jgi:hypothetical protein
MIRAPKSAAASLTLLLCLALLPQPAPAKQNKASERPILPYGFLDVDPVAAAAYDTKGEPVARAMSSLDMMNRKGWETIEKYFPKLGILSDHEIPVDSGDTSNHRFFAALATEDPGRSPTPLVMMICSLKADEVSGPLKKLRDELMEAMNVPDYLAWKLDDLRKGTEALTDPRTSSTGVKYRGPKYKLSYLQSVQLFSMTLALLRKETKWKEWEQSVKAKGYHDLDLPNMEDFTSRLVHQLPRPIAEGETVRLFLYRPGYYQQPITKGEFEERADVVSITRQGSIFQVEQFPVYLTTDQKTWNPSWIEPKDEMKDTTLMARKFEYDWTRFDGPYVWYLKDQLNGRVVYRCAARFSRDGLVLEGERFVSARGEIMKVVRDPNYDPQKMRRFVPGVDAHIDPLQSDWLEFDGIISLRSRPSHLQEMFYQVGGRELLNLQTGPNSFTSALYPPPIAPGQSAAGASSTSEAQVAQSPPLNVKQ